jgi:hypothetical protein
MIGRMSRFEIFFRPYCLDPDVKVTICLSHGEATDLRHRHRLRAAPESLLV